jgi:hypothetical protein
MTEPKRRYGMTPEQWQALRAEARAVIIDRALQRRTIYYSELCAELTTASIKPYSYALVALLEEICEREDAERGVMLASLVVRKPQKAGVEAMPGAGYFGKADNLGRVTDDQAAMWRAERDRVFEVFADGDPGEPVGGPTGRIRKGHAGR